MADFTRRWASRRSRDPFETLLGPHVEHLYKLAYRFTRSSSSTEDLVQDVLIKLYRIRDQVARIEQLRPWLARVLYREYVDRWRRERLVPINFSELPEESQQESADTDAPLADPEQDAIRMEERGRLLAAIEALGEDHRAVVVFHDIEGYTLEELSIVLSLPIGTLKSRIHRARRRLRELLTLPDATFSASGSLSVS